MDEEIREKIIGEYSIAPEWLEEDSWEEHRITLRDEGRVIFDGTIKELVKHLEEEKKYFGEES